MAAEEITLGNHEYRAPGWEIQRRPVSREGLHPADAAWLVMGDHHFVPEEVKAHFMQARNRAAVN